MNFTQILFEKNLKENPQKTFITFKKQNFSFEQVFEQANQIAHKLIKANLKPQDKIAISFWNEPEFVFAYFGVLLAEGIVIPISPLLTQKETQNILKHAHARLLLNNQNIYTSNYELFLAKPHKTTTPKDLAIIIYTSGTTGLPKGVMLSYSNIQAQILAASKALELTFEDSFLGNLSFAHVFGQMDILWAALYQGCTIHLLLRFDASSGLKLLLEKQISILIAVPTMYQLMLRQLTKKSQKFPFLRLCHSGAAHMPIGIEEDIEKHFGIPLQAGYGLTETCSMAFSNPLMGLRKKSSVGLPIQGVQFELRNEANQIIHQVEEIGEVFIKGAIVSNGYLGLPSPNVDGWLATGDLGYKDKDNYLFLVERKKNLIIRSGLKIYPNEVEEILLQHSSIAEAALIGIPSTLQGQKPKAYLVASKICSLEEKQKIIQELKEICQKEIAQFKIPVAFEFIKEIPKTPSGKILKRALLDLN